MKWSSLELLYGQNSFVVKQPTKLFYEFGITTMFVEKYYLLFVCIFLILVLLWFFGLIRNGGNFLIFILNEFFQNANGLILNGGDNLLRFVLLYLIFTNCYKYYVIDKGVFLKTPCFKDVYFFDNLGVFLILSHLSIVYFISGISKIHTDVWFNGVAVYYALIGERFMGTPFNQIIAQNGFIVTISTYLIVFWEIFYLVAIFIKKIRPYYLFIGILMHLGIYIFLMIKDFQLLFISLYGLYFTDIEIKEFFMTIQKKILLLFTTINFKK